MTSVTTDSAYPARALADGTVLAESADARTGSDGTRPGVVDASQMLAQTLVAAGRHAPGRRAVTASMVFGTVAMVDTPVTVELDENSGGRTFTTLQARVVQSDRTCAVATLLLDAPAPDLIRHEVPAPDVPGPYESTQYDMAVTGRDLRIVDNAYTGDPDAPLGPPVLDAWVRIREVPDDQYLHTARTGL